jgi:hypothetical protein
MRTVLGVAALCLFLCAGTGAFTPALAANPPVQQIGNPGGEHSKLSCFCALDEAGRPEALPGRKEAVAPDRKRLTLRECGCPWLESARWILRSWIFRR